MHYILFIPPWSVVGLAEYVRTHPILTFLQKKTQTSYQKTPSRVIVLHPALPVGPALFEMLSLTQYSEPALDPMWFAVRCYVVAWLLIIIICIECHPRRFVW